MTSDEEFLGRWFAEVTKPQLARYNQRMSDARPYYGSPRWDRERMNAQWEFSHDTQPARKLYERAMDDIGAHGEVSEAVDYELTEFKVAETMQAAE